MCLRRFSGESEGLTEILGISFIKVQDNKVGLIKNKKYSRTPYRYSHFLQVELGARGQDVTPCRSEDWRKKNAAILPVDELKRR